MKEIEILANYLATFPVDTDIIWGMAVDWKPQARSEGNDNSHRVASIKIRDEILKA